MAEKIYIFNTIPKIGFPTTIDRTLWGDWWHEYIIATGRSDRAAPAFTTNVYNHNDWNGTPATPAVFDLFYFPNGTWLQVSIGRGMQAKFRHKQDADTTLSSTSGATGGSAYAFGFSLSFDGENITSVSAATYSLDTGELQNQLQVWPSTAINVLAQMYRDGEYTVIEAGQPDPYKADPYAPGGESGTGGGGGDFDDLSEDVTDPAVPDISAVDTGFITLFNPSVSQLNSLASYMWSAGFDLETFKKIFANPMDCILGLSILPKIVPAGSSRVVTVGNISTGVSMTLAASQYVKFDCGSVTVKRYSNSFLDYAPYTKVSIYLPFIGIHELSVDDVMNKSVHVKYNIDILSGACAAFVICGGTTLYTYTGQCAASVPVTSGDWSTMINGVIGAVGGVIKAAVGGAAVGGLLGAVGAGAASLASSAMDVAGMKPSIEHSGNMGGMGGMMGVKTPFLIITRPQQAIPGQQNKYTGYPAFVTKELNALEGYTEIEEIHLENIPGTEQEITEIYNLLRNGVIL